MAAKLRAAAALALSLAAAAPARATLSANAEAALDRGLHHLYSLDYAEARADFRRLIEQEPDNPFGYLFESGAIWWQSSQEYGLFKDTPTLQGLFEEDVDMAIKKADTLTDAHDKGQRADGHFVEGMALGTRGQWALMRGHYVKAFFDGKHAIKHLKKVPKIDSEYHDVDLGLGVYDYQAAHLSGIAKLSGLLGVHGDEKKGLEKLRSAMESGRYSKPQSAEFLAIIFIMDKHDWANALPVVQRLRQMIPESVYFDSLEALVRWRLGQKAESVALGRTMFDKAQGDPTAWNRKLLSMTCGLMGDRCLKHEQAAALRDWMTAAIAATPEAKPKAKPVRHKSKPAPADPPKEDSEAYLTMLHLYRGFAADALGSGDDAAPDYDWVLAHPDFAGAHARAKKCREKGCPASETLLYLRGLSHDE